MKHFLTALFCALLLAGIRIGAQSGAPEIRFDSADTLKFPANIYLGEVAGVATNSKGDVFVYTRTGHPTVTLGGARAFAHGRSSMPRDAMSFPDCGTCTCTSAAATR